MARDMVVRISEGVRRQFAQERYLLKSLPPCL